MDEPINPLVIGGAAATAVILLVAAVVGFRAYKRKQEAEFEAMMSEDGELEVGEAGVPEEEELEPVEYSSMTVSELKEMLQERDLTVGGVKSELVARLEEDDVQLEKFKARLGHVEQVPDVEDEGLLEEIEDDEDDLLEEIEDDEDDLLEEIEEEIEDEPVPAQPVAEAPSEVAEEISDDEFEEFDEELSEEEFDEFEDFDDE